MLILLILATIVNLALAVLLVAVSGFIFGGGPEGMNGEIWSALSWWACFASCLAGPVAGFVARKRGRAGWGVLFAFVPPVGGLLLMSL